MHIFGNLLSAWNLVISLSEKSLNVLSPDVACGASAKLNFDTFGVEIRCIASVFAGSEPMATLVTYHTWHIITILLTIFTITTRIFAYSFCLSF